MRFVSSLSLQLVSITILLQQFAAPAQAAEVIDVPEWVVPYEGPKQLVANVGDTIDFQWEGRHNVYIHPTMNCDLDGAILVGEESGSSKYTFTEKDGTQNGKEMFFSCDIGNGAHCQFGQNLVVTVFSIGDETGASKDAEEEVIVVVAEEEEISEDEDEDIDDDEDLDDDNVVVVKGWVVPYEGPKELVANVGYTIDFEWEYGLHNVYIHPKMNCDADDAVLVGEVSGSSKYTFTEDDGSPNGKEMYFSCDIARHCEFGQNLVVTVFSNDETTVSEEEAEEKISEEDDEEEFVVIDVDSTRIDGGMEYGWDENLWYVQVDGVMGGKSSGEMEFMSSGDSNVDNVMKFTGDIILDGGGFSSVRRRADLDMSDYAGVVVTLEAESYPTTGSMTGLHLQFDDSSSTYNFASAFALPLASSTTATSVYLPMESFDRGTRWGFSCRNGCSLNEAAINGLSIYVLFQEGDFDVRIRSIDAVKEPVSFPSPQVEFESTEDVIDLMQSTIRSGGSLYDKGYIELCIAMYWSALNTIVASNSVVPNSVKAVICAGLEETMIKTTKQDQAWTLRYTMDAAIDDLNGDDRDNYFNWLPVPAMERQATIGNDELCVARTSSAQGVMIMSHINNDNDDNSNDDEEEEMETAIVELNESIDTNEDESAAACATIPEIACGADDFSTLCSLVSSVDGLADALSEGTFTVFAPINAAFDHLDDELDGELEAILRDDVDLLVDILQFHVVDGNGLKAKDLSCESTKIEMSNGKDARIKCKNDKPYGIKGSGNDVPVEFLDTDIIACNGSVIHSINDVLLPVQI